MKRSVVVREFARLTTAHVDGSVDQQTVSTSAFEWLCEEHGRMRPSGASLIQLEDQRSLRLDNFVGVIESPCGTQIEVLPKIIDTAEDAPSARRMLRRMLERVLEVPSRVMQDADIDAFHWPLTEWIAARFLQALDRLIKRGIRFDYRRIEEEQRFQRGRLDLVRQIRQAPGRRHLFQIQHDVFEPDRPENRLLRSALERVRAYAQSADNWRLARELASYLAPVPQSADVSEDFRRWQTDRLMAHYRPIRAWCSLILNEEVPLSTIGKWRGPSLLFPMEKLFERYLACCFREALLPDAHLTCTARSQWLCEHRGADSFRLEPDFLIVRGEKRWVLDAKWKRIDSARSDVNYGLGQDDLYQMFAYGNKYLAGSGDVVLIYPKTRKFCEALEPFHFSDKLRLWVVPFDMDSGALTKHIGDIPLRVGGIGDASVAA